MKKYLIALVVVILLVIIAGAVYLKLSKSTAPEQIACTMEAKICSDGKTYVGRQGPKCEFEACPVNQAVEEMTLTGTYEIIGDDEMFGGEVCFWPDEVSSKLIPRPEGDTRTAWFCFLDPREAKKELNSGEAILSCNNTGAEAKVVVSDYKLFLRQAAGFDRARLVKVLSSSKGKCLDKNN